MKTVLVVVAHADDEVLGCGGTMAKHSAEGDEVFVVIVSDGVTARYSDLTDPLAQKELLAREEAARSAAGILGVKGIRFLRFPDNRCDSVAMLDIVKSIEAACQELKPQIIYTHHGNDLNIDHRIVSQSVLTACRPMRDQSVKAIYGVEVLSSTEWEPDRIGLSFKPNRYVDVSNSMEAKLSAISAYGMEMGEFPHPRSVEIVKAKSMVRGSEAGVAAAEAFAVIREIV
ncbi:PIG-L deacetylase family protein [Thalassospira sp. GB04J01]|uniref:PIG-L deacetylase family protein n=1 Tax=Thalassospira sp. GB04J01 TaxID=1485225 RepID=UPI000C9B4B1F|nr:PIG-L deacetylase family protein [Thalassospira sp. GB04J01]|tara:strand:+ start:92379 stop:93065 length:687 start_codon:yes stop_codon:yes gene_type:complete